MIKVGKAVFNILAGGTTAMQPHPDFSRNENLDTYIVYRILNNTPSDTKSGPSTLDEVEVGISIYSTSFDTLSDLSDKVRADLDRAAYGTYETIELNGIQFVDEDSGFDPVSERYENEQRYIFRVKR